MSEGVTVLFGGPSPEHDVSILTGLQAARALHVAGHRPRAIYWEKAGGFSEVGADLEAGAFVGTGTFARSPLKLVVGEGFVTSGRLGRTGKVFDVGTIVNCCHGGPGEDGSIQACLDLSGIAYTGPTAAGAALGMDKLAFGSLVAATGLPTLQRATVDPGAPDRKPSFDAPYIVKPRFGGSSIGIEVVTDWDTAVALAGQSVHLRAGAVVEPWLESAVDLQLSVRSWPALTLSPVERPLRAAGGAGGILGYADKYVGGEGMASAPRELPAQLPADVERLLNESAAAICSVAGLRGVARIDFLWDEPAGDLFLNEINTIPGSLSKYLWEAADPAVGFAALLMDLLAEASARPATYWSTAGADGSALRSAGSIASKLG